MKFKCFLDMDGVLTDFVNAYCKVKKVPNPYDEINNRGIWDTGNILISSGHFKPCDYWQGCDYYFWADMEPMHDADQIVQLVVNKFGWGNVCVLSRPIMIEGFPHLTGQCVAGKLYWLQKNYPELVNNCLFGTAKHKLASDDWVLVDDNDENIDKFMVEGGRSVQVARLWNRKHGIASEGLTIEKLKASLETQTWRS